MNQIEIENLSLENVWELTEEDAFRIALQLQTKYEKDMRNRYVKIINTAFEFRRISKTQRTLADNLAKYGFKFFPLEDVRTLQGICKRKAPARSVF
ncbi:MAG: hypothetical protein LBT76_04520 [Tannerella sp.]|jgi:hypothetical protein|nr:hypothetical protein [Tannerella sp.]